MSKRSNPSEARSSRRSKSTPHLGNSLRSFSSTSQKGAPSPLKPERKPVRQHSDPDLCNVKPVVRVTPYPDARKVWNAFMNIEDDAGGRDVVIRKNIGGQLEFVNTAKVFKTTDAPQTYREASQQSLRRDGSQTSKMNDRSLLSSRSTCSTRSAFSARCSSGAGSRRSESAGSARSSASRSELSARSTRSTSSFSAHSAFPFDGFASQCRTTPMYSNPGRDQIFIDDPSLRVQQVHSYKRSEYGGGFTWARKSAEAQQPFETVRLAPKYGFQPCQKPLKEICARCNPDQAGPGFSRTPYGGFCVRYESDYERDP